MRELFVLDEHHDIGFAGEGPTKMSGRDHDGLASRALTEVVARCAHQTTPDDPLARASESRHPQNLAPCEANPLIAEGREIEARVHVATIALDGRSWTLPWWARAGTPFESTRPGRRHRARRPIHVNTTIVLADGNETSPQLDRRRELDAELARGLLISPPLPT